MKISWQVAGGKWQVKPKQTAVDNLRNNALEAVGWEILRYTTKQIKEQAETYCLPNVVKTINDLGGVEEGSVAARKIDPDAGVYQPSLFD